MSFSAPPATALAAAEPAAGISTIATPTLWAVTIAAVLALLAVDFVATRKPHEVSMREATLWSVLYVALPLAFGVYVTLAHGREIGVGYYTGYVVEKSLSVDNLFVFMLLLAAFAVPRELQQRVLLLGIVGALVLRGLFIALGAAALSAFAVVFLLFGLVLLATGAKLLRDAVRGASHEQTDPDEMRVVRLLRRFWPVTEDYRGARLTVQEHGRRALTPLALVVVAVFMTDIVFAVDSVPAVYGITSDPYLVFATNAFALLGLRALYFVVENLLTRLVHLSYGLALILGFIGAKLVLHWAHTEWEGVPTIDNRISLVVVLGVLAVTVATSLLAVRRQERRRAAATSGGVGGAGGGVGGEVLDGELE